MGIDKTIVLMPVIALRVLETEESIPPERKAPNGTSDNICSDSDLDIFAIEVEGYMNDIRGLANSRDSNGHFMFAGTKVTTLPFTKNVAGTVIYNGNQTESKLELDTGYKLPLSISGNKLAGVITRGAAKIDMFQVMQDFVTALKANNKVGAFVLSPLKMTLLIVDIASAVHFFFLKPC